jgi:hypothetical protein
VFLPAVVRGVGDLLAANQKGLIQHQSPCGSEPAREEGVSVDIHVADTPPSRAGSLPQWFGGVADEYFRHKKAAYQTRLFLGRVLRTEKLRRCCRTYQ